MAYLVDDYDSDVMNANTYGMVTREDMSFLQRLNESVEPFREMSSRYLRKSAEIFDTFDFEAIRNKLKTVSRRWSDRFGSDEISLLSTIQDLQGARPRMRKYAMAMPRLRKLYLQGRCEGFGELYEMEDRIENVELYHEYREVMNGSFVGDDESDAYVTYLDVLDENGYETLSAIEKVIIRQGWDRISEWLDEADEDPTSMVGAKL